MLDQAAPGDRILVVSFGSGAGSGADAARSRAEMELLLVGEEEEGSDTGSLPDIDIDELVEPASAPPGQTGR